jgi:hypothetical protein
MTLDNKFYYLLFYSFFRICQPRTFYGYNFRFCPPSADLSTKGAGLTQIILTTNEKLPLRPLRSASGFFQTIFLSFYFSCISS